MGVGQNFHFSGSSSAGSGSVSGSAGSGSKSVRFPVPGSVRKLPEAKSRDPTQILENPGKILGKSWENPRKISGTSVENSGKTRRNSEEIQAWLISRSSQKQVKFLTLRASRQGARGQRQEARVLQARRPGGMLCSPDSILFGPDSILYRPDRIPWSTWHSVLARRAFCVVQTSSVAQSTLCGQHSAPTAQDSV